MTREQAKNNLIAFGIDAPTEEQISGYLNQLNGEIQNERSKVEQYKDKADKFDAAQKELEAERIKNMTAEERLAQAEKEAQERALDFTRRTNKLEAETILLGAGLTKEDFGELIDSLVKDDVETTKAAANTFATLISKQRDMATQKAKENILDGTGKPGGGEEVDKVNTKTDAEKIAEGLAKSSVDIETAKSVIDGYK